MGTLFCLLLYVRFINTVAYRKFPINTSAETVVIDIPLNRLSYDALSDNLSYGL